MIVYKGGVMIKKILVPIDGFETARKALQYSVDLAKLTGSSISPTSWAPDRTEIENKVGHLRTKLYKVSNTISPSDIGG
jgi:nucleotide-binding universal stress UspA family protein